MNYLHLLPVICYIAKIPTADHERKRRINKMVDEATKKTLAAIPLLKTKAGPRDKDSWVIRLKEEYGSLIKV